MVNLTTFSNQAAVDSIKLQEQIKKDPNYSNQKVLEESLKEFPELDFATQSFSKKKSGLNALAPQDRNEQKIYEKLKLLQKTISQPAPVKNYGQDMREFENYGSSNDVSAQIKNLEQMMSAMGETAPDPELQQLGGMLENILDIQHPSRVQERLKQNSEQKKGKVYSVNLKSKADNISSLQENTVSADNLKLNAFFTADEDLNPDHTQNALEAAVHETQTILNGSVVKLRLTADITLQGTTIPKNTFVYGMAALKGERLEIKIENLQHHGSIFPVQLSVYDMDGIEGIYIPGAINRDATKASADRSIQTLGLTGITDSWGAQAAGMGIEAAKSLMSKKVKLIKVVVKAGYKVLLYDEKQKDLKP